MLDPIIQFVQGIFSAIGRGIGYVIAWIMFPFMSASRWYASRGIIIKAVVGMLVALILVAYGHFVWITQVWNNFNPDYIDAYKLKDRKLPAGQEIASTDASTSSTTAAPKLCQRSAIVDVTADLIDMEVNQNTWITSTPLYKMGLFGIDWDHTPFLDNKASFQRGVNLTIRRTTADLVDRLARIRGTSGINMKLQDARSAMQYDETAWYINWPLSVKDPAPKQYNLALSRLRAFNEELASCQSLFDGRADNLLQFLDNIANDLGNTSNILTERSKNYNAGWFDTRADDRFWFAYGQMYAYYGILSATQVDFSSTIAEKNLNTLWKQMLERFRAALNIQPVLISNGAEDGIIMPSHLATQGFYLLNARTSLIEIRDVLDR